jgi:hypothetical protein
MLPCYLVMGSPTFGAKGKLFLKLLLVPSGLGLKSRAHVSPWSAGFCRRQMEVTFCFKKLKAM